MQSISTFSISINCSVVSTPLSSHGINYHIHIHIYIPSRAQISPQVTKMAPIKAFFLLALSLPTIVSAIPQASSPTSSTTSSAASATPTYGTAAKNLIYAQQLVYDLLSRHSDLAIVGIHGIPPSGGNGSIIAINLDRIGKPDDSDDDAVAVDHKSILAPNAADPTKFEIATPLFDAAGNMLNFSINLVFNYQEGRIGDDLLGLFTRAYTYRQEVSRRVISQNILFQPILQFNISCKWLQHPSYRC